VVVVGTAPDGGASTKRMRRAGATWLALGVATALVIRAAGTNCEAEMARGFDRAGARVDISHVRALLDQPRRLERYDIIGLPGGVSYGDDVASGRVLAMLVRQRLYPALRAAVERGAAILGICNGFQVLAQAGLLPGPDDGVWPASPPAPTIALADNAAGQYEDRWVGLAVDPDSPCLWTRGLDAAGGTEMVLPVGHGEGRLAADATTVQRLIDSGRAPLRYRQNFNGSAGAIAGVCDASGRVFGLMPHPDRFLDWTRHPHYTRLDKAALAGHPAPGLRLFINAVQAASEPPTNPAAAPGTTATVPDRS